MVSKVNGRILELYVKNNEGINQAPSLLLIKGSVDFKKLQLLEHTHVDIKAILDSHSIHSLELYKLAVET